MCSVLVNNSGQRANQVHWKKAIKMACVCVYVNALVHVACAGTQLRQEKCELEETLEKEQEYQVNKLMRRIEKLQAEVVSKQATLEQVLQINPVLDIIFVLSMTFGKTDDVSSYFIVVKMHSVLDQRASLKGASPVPS